MCHKFAPSGYQVKIFTYTNSKSTSIQITTILKKREEIISSGTKNVSNYRIIEKILASVHIAHEGYKKCFFEIWSVRLRMFLWT